MRAVARNSRVSRQQDWMMTVADLASLGSRPGTYALVCPSACAAEIPVGRLGALVIRKGFYIYVGSAFGPGGIRARVARHVSQSLSPHWHVDYLWPALRIGEIWYSHDPMRREHAWVHILRRVTGCSVPLRRFGASDCRCEAHLLFFAQVPLLGSFRAHVHSSIPEHHRVRRIMAYSGAEPGKAFPARVAHETVNRRAHDLGTHR
jgi:Uri superfamily endonuclease